MPMSLIFKIDVDCTMTGKAVMAAMFIVTINFCVGLLQQVL
jgi:hypothetical protein